MEGVLVIVPCGQQKIWDKFPDHGPTPARNAYTGSPFVVNRTYAEHFAERWVILSAKYGFIPPDFAIPGPYNVTFKQPSTHPVDVATLHDQIQAQQLDTFDSIIGLGGKDYRGIVEHAFAGTSVRLHFPFAGLKLGLAMRAANEAIANDRPWPEHSRLVP